MEPKGCVHARVRGMLLLIETEGGKGVHYTPKIFIHVNEEGTHVSSREREGERE